MVIIGVLVAIAVPVYLNYRKGAADKSAQSDVRGAISAVEQFYTDNGNAYPADHDRQAPTAPRSMTGAPAGKATVSGRQHHSATTHRGATYVICGSNTDG